MSLMGRGSRAGGNCNTIEKLRGAAGNASRKIIIFFERPRTGQDAAAGLLPIASLLDLLRIFSTPEISGDVRPPVK